METDAEMDSDLKIFFDAAAAHNLDTDSLNSLTTGFTRAAKVALRHS